MVYYHAGVGSSGSALDTFTGGDFGIGLDAVSAFQVALSFVPVLIIFLAGRSRALHIHLHELC